MRQLLRQSGMMMAIAVPFGLVGFARAEAMPLQPGAYSAGSRYIQIARRGDRWCFQGFSVRATSISSLTPDPRTPSLYRLAGTKDSVVRQDRVDQLAYGSAANLLPYPANPQFGNDLSAEMKQCLNTQKPYYKQIQSTR